MTLVSVIIPTYERTRLLTERALPSVFAQTVTDQEVIVVGDGTERATVKAMVAEPRVRFWNRPHYPYPADERTRWGLLGLAALNYGLDQATGEWIAVLGDDDEWTPDHHAVLLAAAEASGADHVYGMSDTIKNGVPTGQTYGRWPVTGDGAFCNGANLYRRSLGYRYNLAAVNKHVQGDGDLWLRMVRDGVRFEFVPRIVHHYHRNYP